MPKRRKKIPLRTCIGCRQSKPKRELVRVVRAEDGNVFVDGEGKANGRGAYLCGSEACLGPGLARWLENALNVEVREERLDDLRDEVRQMTARGADETRR